MSSKLLTVYIPTHNRFVRLERSLNDIIEEIVRGGLSDKVAILVGDNGSEDTTPSVCAAAHESAMNYGIKLNYFRNTENLGFSGNIFAGCSRVETDWLMFVSDDDNICVGSLQQVCRELESYLPTVAVYNFSQDPYSYANPLIRESVSFSSTQPFDDLSTLISWPKLTGITLKSDSVKKNIREIQVICEFARNFPHVLICLYLLRDDSILLKSSTFVAEPDKDYLEHVNFLPYIGEYLIHEISMYRSTFAFDDRTFDTLIQGISRTNIVDASLSALIGYYRGDVKLTAKVKGILWNNIARSFLGFRSTSDDLPLERPRDRFYLKTFVLIVLVFFSRILLRVRGRRPQLMKDGF